MRTTTPTRSARVTGALVGVLLLAPAVAGGALLAPATAADPSAAEYAAGYLQDRLAEGGHYLSVEAGGTVYPDHGVTADAVLALAAAGTARDEAAAATAWLEQERPVYTGFGDPNEIYAGAVAKLLNVAIALEQDPTSFGGMDLVTTLEARLQANGRYADQTRYGDASNVFGQSLAIGGLARAGRPTAPTAVRYLRDQQCADGGFRIYFDAAPCVSDPDATALAVQALIRVAGADDADVREGLDHLAAKQDDTTGAVGGSDLTAAPNANSTGLAGQAFLAGGRSAQARLAQSYVLSLQYGCEFPEPLRGGIAYDQATYDARLAAGPTATPIDQDNRSTAQAALALAGTPLFVVTARGADAVAPAPDCAPPTTAPPTTTPPTTTPPTTAPTTTTPPTTTPPTTTAPPTTATTTSATTSTTTGGAVVTTTDDDGAVLGAGSTRDPQAAPVRSARAGSLAATGSDALPVVLGAAALVVVGGGLLLVRRLPRGRHQ